MLLLASDLDPIKEFLEAIYRDESGYIYIALKYAKDKCPITNCKEREDCQHFIQKHFEYPNQLNESVALVVNKRQECEVYYAPALFDQPSGQKKHVKGARVVWVEFDGKTPSDLSGLPAPSIRVRSSIEGHEHWYWCSDQLIEPYDLERINRSLTYELGADVSGWDANQVLRPPATFNHKRHKEVQLISTSKGDIDFSLFDGLPEPPPTVEAPVPTEIPDITDAVALVNWEKIPQAHKLFIKGGDQGAEGKSGALMSLGYYLAELQVPDEHAFAILLNADERWGKFKGRADQHTRLMEIVVRARTKFPLEVAPEENLGLVSMGFKTLLAQEINVEWVWEGYLQQRGYMLLTGPSGIGKTQFSLDAAANFALGKDYLGQSVGEPRKIGFFSLEMGLADLKYFLETQKNNFTDDEIDVLEENLRFYALGEPIYMNRTSEKKRIEQVIEKEGLRGIMVDSLGSSTEKSLSNEEETKQLMDWNAHIRNSLDVFTWWIHHLRKASGDNKVPNKLADIYGSVYVTSPTTSAFVLWPTSSKNMLQVRPVKVRLIATPPPFSVARSQTLGFTKVVNSKSNEEADIEDEQFYKEVVEELEAAPSKGEGQSNGFSFGM